MCITSSSFCSWITPLTNNQTIVGVASKQKSINWSLDKVPFYLGYSNMVSPRWTQRFLLQIKVWITINVCQYFDYSRVLHLSRLGTPYMILMCVREGFHYPRFCSTTFSSFFNYLKQWSNLCLIIIKPSTWLLLLHNFMR